MMFTISGETFEDLRDRLIVAAGHFGLTVTSQPMSFPFPNDDVKSVVETDAVSPKKPSRSKKVISEPAVDPEVVLAPVVSKEEAFAALQNLAASPHGTDLARDLLSNLGAKRFSELDANHYCPFVIACNELSSK